MKLSPGQQQTIAEFTRPQEYFYNTDGTDVVFRCQGMQFEVGMDDDGRIINLSIQFPEHWGEEHGQYAGNSWIVVEQ